MSVPATLDEALLRYEVVIGLEVHAQLKTQSKLFSSAPNRYDTDRPNRFVSEYCFGLPGVLPVLNLRAVELAVRAGLALGCSVRRKSVWSRKQYFYPDLPKGYQISQYDEPICEHGHLEVDLDTGRRHVRIARIHMEEDAGKSLHLEGANYSVVDYNRAGVPLIEIVSSPDIRSAKEAVAYLKELRSILMTLDVCDGNMEEGSFRCDANVSIRPIGTEPFGTRCEIKNVNSFRFVEQAIEYEVLRQARVVASGGAVVQETRLFDHAKKETRSMRSKEEAHDYRYFPDPDLPPLVIPDGWVDGIAASLPELPAARRTRYAQLGVPEEHARTFAEETELAAFFDRAIVDHEAQAVGIAQLIKGELLRELKEDPSAIKNAKIQPRDLAELVKLKEEDKISSTQQKKLFQEMLRNGTSLRTLLDAEGEQIDDDSILEPIIDELIAKNRDAAQKLKAGQDKLLGFFVGQVMKATQGKAKPPLVQRLVLEKVSRLP